ncbi:MAG: hypothetical protein KDE67_13210 [Sphingobium sp.]|jgi:uncharacterized phiE125 gp8 family phage protein|nr:hypothetical protein [Sphingobium sp.]MCP5398314.1 hypothetical protein [Sphingomonas sp.]
MTVQMQAVAQTIVDAARDETKAWLRIETAYDDSAIAALARAAIGMAEDFCAQLMFTRGGTEVLTASSEWVRMRACPVRSITAARGLPAEGASFALASDAYAIDIGADGDGWVRVIQQGAAGRVEVDFTAGIVDDWPSLPEALRQGIVRLAAHLFAERNSDAPPAIVTALWRPWRRMRIA